MRSKSKINAGATRYMFANAISWRNFLRLRINRLLAAMLIVPGLMIGAAAAATLGAGYPDLIAIG
jgi:hypothetical protein